MLTTVLGPTLLLTAFANGVFLVGAAALFIFFNFMAQPSYSALLADYTPRSIQGRIFGFLFLAFFIVGATSGVLTGWLVERYGTDWAFAALGGVGAMITVVAGLLVLAAARQARIQRSAASG